MQLKKISAIFLAAALMLFSLATVAGAEDTKIFEVEVEALTTTSTLSSSPIIYSPGEEFTVKISAGQNTGITSVKFKIDYDETALEVVSDKCKATNLFTASDELTHKVSSTGDGYFLFDSDNYPKISTATGTFVELTFVAKEVCVKNSAVAVSLFKNSDGFCMVQTASGLEVVPFASNGDTFSIHDLDTENKIITPAKCLEDGYTTYSCKACNESVVGNVVPATGHSQGKPVQENIVAPTCTKEGSYDSVVYCSVCHTELSRENKVIPILAHTPAEAVEENRVEPTCTEEGSYDSVVYCADCHTELSRETKAIPVLAHTPAEAVKENKVEPTCTKEGSYDSVVYCADCHAELSRETKAIPVLAHTPAEAVEENRVEPTCTEEGSYDSVVYCADCHTELSRENFVINALEHKYGETTVIEPEYKQEGYSTHTCTVCGYEEKFDFKPALTYILGDVNGDETINDADAVYLLMHTFFPDEYPVNQVGDFDGDGAVTDADAVYILMYTFFPEDYPIA